MPEMEVMRVSQRGRRAERDVQNVRVVATVGLGEVARDLALASGTSVVDASRKVVKDTAVQTLQLAQVYAPKDRGELRESIKIEYSDGGMTAQVFPTAPHAAYIEFGTGLHNELLPPGARRPYIIEPKTPGGTLRFVASDGSIVFTKRVIHPGIKAQPYMRPAAERVADAFARGIGTAGTKILVEGA